LKPPADENDQAVAKLHQVHQVDEQPDQPRDKSVELQAARFDHGRRASDYGEAALVVIMKRLGHLAASAFGDCFGDVAALLHRGWRDPGNQFAVLFDMGQVADDEDFGMTGDSQIGRDHHAALPV